MKEKDIEQIFQSLQVHRVTPTHIVVNREAVAEMAKHRPGGGNSRQRRRWRRMWTPKKEMVP
jgi:hypothetical protein